MNGEKSVSLKKGHSDDTIQFDCAPLRLWQGRAGWEGATSMVSGMGSVAAMSKDSQSQRAGMNAIWLWRADANG